MMVRTFEHRFLCYSDVGGVGNSILSSRRSIKRDTKC